MQLLANLVLRLTGWKINGLPPDVPKYLLIAAPHTSNWDFLFGICALFSLRMQLNWFAKSSIFIGPVGWILKSWGGIPLDRKRSANTVDAVVAEFARRDAVAFGLAPEGTRSHTDTWKSGFYYMALRARVPLALAYFDYERREVGVGMTLELTGAVQEDMEKIRRFYSTKKPRYPEKFGPVRLREETQRAS